MFVNEDWMWNSWTVICANSRREGGECLIFYSNKGRSELFCQCGMHSGKTFCNKVHLQQNLSDRVRTDLWTTRFQYPEGNNLMYPVSLQQSHCQYFLFAPDLCDDVRLIQKGSYTPAQIHHVCLLHSVQVSYVALFHKQCLRLCFPHTKTQ